MRAVQRKAVEKDEVQLGGFEVFMGKETSELGLGPMQISCTEPGCKASMSPSTAMQPFSAMVPHPDH